MNFDAWRHFWRGRILDKMHRPQDAIAAYRQALACDPGYVLAARNLGYLLAQRPDYAEAEDYFLLALRLQPDADTWYNLAYLRDHLGQKERAIAAFNQALQLRPKLDQAWYGLGLAHASLGHHAEAVAALEQAALLQARNPHIWYALGMAHHHCHDPDKVAAVAKHLSRFDLHMTRHLIQETERNDLRYLIAELDS